MLAKLSGRMLTLESLKTAPPKFTRSFSHLVKFLSIEIDEEQMAAQESSVRRLVEKEKEFAPDASQFYAQAYTSEPRQLRVDSLGSAQTSAGPFEWELSPKRFKRKRKSKGDLKQNSKSPVPTEKTKRKQKQPETKKSLRKGAHVLEQEPTSTELESLHGGATIDGVKRQLVAHESIHTIHEDDLQKEDDVEESRGQPSPTGASSPGHLRSQLDISLSKFPAMNEPGGSATDHSNYHKQAVSFQPEFLSLNTLPQEEEDQYCDGVDEEDFQNHRKRFDIVNGDSGIGCVEVSHQDRRERQQLQRVLAQAKKQYQEEKKNPEKVLYIVGDYIENPKGMRHKQRKEDFSSKFMLTSPPAIASQQKVAIEGTVAHKLTQSHEQRLSKALNKKFLKKIQQRQQQAGSPEQNEIERLKQSILQQHISNQERIRERHKQLEGGDKGSRSDSTKRNQSENKGRKVTLRQFFDQRKQKALAPQSLSTSIDYADKRPQPSLQSQINRQRAMKDASHVASGHDNRQEKQRLSNPQLRNRLKHIAVTSVNKSLADPSTIVPETADIYQPGAENVGNSRSLNISHDQGNGAQDIRHTRYRQQKQISHSLEISQIHDRSLRARFPSLPASSNLGLTSDQNDKVQQSEEQSSQLVLNLSQVPVTQQVVDRPRRAVQEYVEDGFSWKTGAQNVNQKSESTSGNWRQPIGGASAGISTDGRNNFSVVTHKHDTRSQANQTRPSMMFNTMYSGEHPVQTKAKRAKNLIEPYVQMKTLEGFTYQRERLDIFNQNEEIQRSHAVKHDDGFDEPSLPQFPPSSLEAASSSPVHSPLIASSLQWKDGQSVTLNHRNRDASRNHKIEGKETKGQRQTDNGSRNVSSEHKRWTNGHQVKSRGVPSHQKNQDFRIMQRRTQTSQNSSYRERMVARPGPYEDPLIRHYQTRIGTRGPGTAENNNQDLEQLPKTPLMRTVQDWRSIRNSTNGYDDRLRSLDQNREIDGSVKQFIISQQSKRKQIQTSNQVRHALNQTSSMQDKREIFSEEDFCAPHYHNFQLPEFSRETHEHLLFSQKQKLDQQRKYFEDKAGRSSSQISRHMVEGDGDREMSNTIIRSMAATISESQQQTMGSRYLPVWSSQVKQRILIDECQPEADADLNQNPLIQNEHLERSFPNTTVKRAKPDFDNADGGYETLTQDEERGADGNHFRIVKSPRLSLEVAALIADTEDDEEESKDCDPAQGPDINQVQDKQQLSLEDHACGFNDEAHNEVRGDDSFGLKEGNDFLSQSAPDKEIFEYSERMDKNESIESSRRSNKKQAEHPLDLTFQQTDASKMSGSFVHYAISPRKPTLDLMEQPKADQQMANPAGIHKHSSVSIVGDYNDSGLQNNEAMERLLSRGSGRSDRSNSSFRQRLTRVPKNVQQRVATLRRRQEFSQDLSTKKVSMAGQAILASSQNTNYVVFDQHQKSGEDSDDEGQFESRSRLKNLGKRQKQKKETLQPRLSKLSSQELQKGHLFRHQSHESQKTHERDVDNCQFVTVMRRSEMSGSHRHSANEAKSFLPKSIHTNSGSSQVRLSRMSLEKRQRQQVP